MIELLCYHNPIGKSNHVWYPSTTYVIKNRQEYNLYQDIVEGIFERKNEGIFKKNWPVHFGSK